MTHVVTSTCVDHKYQECVVVCPVEAGACIPECPVDAIFADTDVPEEEEHWIERNAVESVDAEIAEGDSPVLAD